MVEVIHWDQTVDGPLSEEAMSHKMQGLGYASTCYIYPPGCDFPPHTHGYDKLDGVLSGYFELSMMGETVILAAGDMLYIPAHEVHAARVVGKQDVVSLDGTKSGHAI